MKAVFCSLEPSLKHAGMLGNEILGRPIQILAMDEPTSPKAIQSSVGFQISTQLATNPILMNTPLLVHIPVASYLLTHLPLQKCRGSESSQKSGECCTCEGNGDI